MMLLTQTHHTQHIPQMMPVFDESIQNIQRYLDQHVHTPSVEIDVRFLGLPGIHDTIPQSWREKTIYPVRVHFSHILLGPLYQPGRPGGPCPLCLERRWLANRAPEEQRAVRYGRALLATGLHYGLPEATLATLGAIVENMLQQNSIEPWFSVLSLDTLHIRRYQLQADSLCPLCAHPVPDTADAQSYRLEARPKSDVDSYRLQQPRDYTLPESGYVNPYTGVIAASTNLELFHTVTAPVSGVFHQPGIQRRGISTVGWGGHSTNFRTSRRIGMLEALERYCGHLARAKSTHVYGSYHELQEHALDPRSCGLYPEATYRELTGRLVPFDCDQRLSWVWGYSFKKGQPVLVPEQLAYYFPQSEQVFVDDTSNGCAIGSCLEEAIFHGLMELIERDSFLLHWYAKLAAPRIDPGSIRQQKTRHLLDRIERIGYELYLLDTRLDIAVPTVTALGILKEDQVGKLVISAGASLDPDQAIHCAVSELAAYMSSMQERVTPELAHLRAMATDFRKVTSIEQHTLLYGLPEMARHAQFLLKNTQCRSVEDTYAEWNQRRPRHLDLRADLLDCMQYLFALNLDVVVVDQSAPELRSTDLKVARVLVPGLVPIDFGWGRHRVCGLPRMLSVPRQQPRNAASNPGDFGLQHINLTPHPFP
jgi:ribosomal protein S12 methylthiotransferase accessory factor